MKRNLFKAWLQSPEPGSPTPAGHLKSVVIMVLLCIAAAIFNGGCGNQEPLGSSQQEDFSSLDSQVDFDGGMSSDLALGLPAEVYQHDQICREFLPVMIAYLEKPANTKEEVWSDLAGLFEERYGAGTWPSQLLIEQLSTDGSSVHLPGVPSNLRDIIGRINGLGQPFNRVLSRGEPMTLLEKEIDRYIKVNRGQDLSYLYVLLSSMSLYRNNPDYAWFVDEFSEPVAVAGIPDWALCDTAGAAIGAGAGAAACTLGYFIGRWLDEHY